jgi:hypothetical protein
MRRSPEDVGWNAGERPRGHVAAFVLRANCLAVALATPQLPAFCPITIRTVSVGKVRRCGAEAAHCRVMQSLKGRKASALAVPSSAVPRVGLCSEDCPHSSSKVGPLSVNDVFIAPGGLYTERDVFV